MKNILYFAMMLSLVLATSCSKNKDVPTWDTSLGKARFATAQTWKISGNGITQVWSDAVEIINAKSIYDGENSTGGYRIDFRSNPDYKGSLFSWRAVAEVENLCPPPWRVPTKDDFIDLDKAMGGTGNERAGSEFINTKYLALWGGAYGGLCGSAGTRQNQGRYACYWSATEYNATDARILFFDSDGNINPQTWNRKYFGFTLRCVRD